MCREAGVPTAVRGPQTWWQGKEGWSMQATAGTQGAYHPTNYWEPWAGKASHARKGRCADGSTRNHANQRGL